MRLFRNKIKQPIFQQDGASIHRSNKARNTINAWGIKLLDWPPNSPDVSPIENAWAIVAEEMRKKKISSFAEF